MELTVELAWLCGLIIGDGHLYNSAKSKRDASPDYRIAIDISSKECMAEAYNIIYKLTKTTSTPKRVAQKGRKPRLRLDVRNKALFKILTEELGIAKGKKCDCASIPAQIIHAQHQIKKAFIAGYFDADGGKRGHTIGFTSASKQLIKEVSAMLDEFGIEHARDSWRNAKYQKDYFGIRMTKKGKDIFLNEMRIHKRYAELPERSNGTDFKNNMKVQA